MLKRLKRLFTVVVVATLEEEAKAKLRFPHTKIIQTGIGGVNVYMSLRHIPRWFKIINFGYAGSNNINIDKEVMISTVESYHPLVDEYQDLLEPKFILNKEGVPCYTNNDFVTETNMTRPCVFDMELVYILAMGFKNVKSIKIISDNLSLHEYDKTIKEEKKND